MTRRKLTPDEARRLRDAVRLVERAADWPQVMEGAYGGAATFTLIADMEAWLRDWLAAHDVAKGLDR